MTMTENDEILARLALVEARLDALEANRVEAAVPSPRQKARIASEAAAVPPAAAFVPDEFDLALIGRTLIVFGGAYLLRAITESGVVPTPAGVALGILYAMSWSLLALRPSTPRASAVHHAVATTFIGLPLIFEAARRFHVLDAWSSMLVLSLITALLVTVAWRRRIEGIAWMYTLAALAFVPLLTAVTSAIAPYTIYLIALGVTTLWLGYVLDWYLLRWVVAMELDLMLALLTGLLVTHRLSALSPTIAIAVLCLAVTAYAASFAIRTLVREREVVAFEIAQSLALLVIGLGGAMWIAATSAPRLEIPLAAVMLLMAAASYGVAFWFVPRHFGRPANFVFYSSVALMLIIGGGAFIARGITNSLFWAALVIACTWFAARFRKGSLALHAAVYLLSGLVGAGLIELGARSLLLKIANGWTAPSYGTFVLLLASLIAASLRPIERQGTFELWNVAKLMLLAELGWILATLSVIGIGFAFLDETQPAAEVVAVVRTAVFAALTVLSASVSRFPSLSPAKILCDTFMALLIVKLIGEDFRLGNPSTLFLSLAIAGVALIVTARLRRGAMVLRPAGTSP